MTEAELLARMPLPTFISVTSAAEILGGGADRVQELLDLIRKGNLYSCSHALTLGSTREILRLGLTEAMPLLTLDPNPATVFIESDDVLWRWCVDVEAALHPHMKVPPKEVVETRFGSLKSRFVERILGSQLSPAPHAATLAPGSVVGKFSDATETREQRQDRRLQACIDAGLPMNTRAALSRLPDGVGEAADREGVTRQAFSADVKDALQRRECARREGQTVHRA